MSKAIRWQIPFQSVQGVQYRIDIYDEGYSGDHVQITAGSTPFTTDEDNSDNVFEPVRSQTGTIQICTQLPSGGMLSLDDILPSDNTARPVIVNKIDSSTTPATEAVEWQGFLSCETYSQDYVGIPQVLDIHVNSVLETMRSVKIDAYYAGQTQVLTVEDLVHAISEQMEVLGVQTYPIFSVASEDILDKYIFVSQYFDYKKSESLGDITYIYSSSSLYDILSDICAFMGWCLREDGQFLYFKRIGADELNNVTADMSSLTWMGKGHQRTIMQGAKEVSVDTKIKDFETHFEMPVCPINGLSKDNIYTISRIPWWLYDKCTRANVGMFSSYDVDNCFLAYFYGLRNNSSDPWDRLYEDIGFSNCIYLTGKEYEDTSYVKRCVIRNVLEFSVICGVSNTLEDVGHLILNIKNAAIEGSSSGYIRCGMQFLGKYYNGVTGAMWVNNANASFKVPINSDFRIEIPRFQDVYTFDTGYIYLYLYDDFGGSGTSAFITDISLKYEPPFKRDIENLKENRYVRALGAARDEMSINLNLASAFSNPNGLSHIYGVKRYWSGPDYMDYLEPIQELTYNTADGTENRRPEVDLLDRMAAYYGQSRQRLELEVAHPTVAPLPRLLLNGINDGKVYLPLSESRDWRTNVCKLTCFEVPAVPSES